MLGERKYRLVGINNKFGQFLCFENVKMPVVLCEG